MGPDTPGADGGAPGADPSLPAADPDTRDQRLARRQRLQKRGEFRRVQDRGQRYTSGTLILLILPNAAGHRRLGVTVSSKVGNAVARNRVKRWFREVFRKHRNLLPPSVDV
ncbi:MAG: ribonuclease P protein component, partial [Myxococcales bacterium]